MSPRDLLDRLIPARMRGPALDAAARQALRQSRLIAAQVRQFQLETDLYRRGVEARRHHRGGGSAPTEGAGPHG